MRNFAEMHDLIAFHGFETDLTGNAQHSGAFYDIKVTEVASAVRAS